MIALIRCSGFAVRLQKRPNDATCVPRQDEKTSQATSSTMGISCEDKAILCPFGLNSIFRTWNIIEFNDRLLQI